MDDTPGTLAAPHTHAVEIRKSRFRASAAPATDADAALAFVREASDAGANHNCWAYRVGQAYRFGDDGEPTGSAGKPILAAIDGQRLDQVAVVVSRWFGGIKLGIGGLVRAYGGTAAECLRGAPQLPLVAMARRQLDCGFAEWPLLKNRLQAWQAEVEHEEFGVAGVRVQLTLPERHVDALDQLVADVSHGRGRLRVVASAG